MKTLIFILASFQLFSQEFVLATILNKGTVVNEEYLFTENKEVEIPIYYDHSVFIVEGIEPYDIEDMLYFNKGAVNIDGDSYDFFQFKTISNKEVYLTELYVFKSYLLLYFIKDDKFDLYLITNKL